jgi:hypothetical protein
MALCISNVTVSNHRLLNNFKTLPGVEIKSEWDCIAQPSPIYAFMACMGTNLPL